MTRQKKEAEKTFKSRERSLDSEIDQLQAGLEATALKGTKVKQHLQSFSFQGLCMHLIEKLSYRDTAKTITRFLHLNEESSLKYTTLEDRIESIGQELSNAYESKAEEILEANHIDKSSGVIDAFSSIPSSVRNPGLPS